MNLYLYSNNKNGNVQQDIYVKQNRYHEEFASQSALRVVAENGLYHLMRLNVVKKRCHVTL